MWLSVAEGPAWVIWCHTLGHNLVVTELGGRATSYQKAEKRQRERKRNSIISKTCSQEPPSSSYAPSWGDPLLRCLPPGAAVPPAAHQEPNTGGDRVDASR